MTITSLPGWLSTPGRFFRRQFLAFPLLLAVDLALPGIYPTDPAQLPKELAGVRWPPKS